MIYCIAGDDGQQIERRDTAVEVQSSSRRIARKVVERESLACGTNKGVVDGDGCAMRCIIMMSLLGTRWHFSFPCESRYLRARCHWFARSLQNRTPRRAIFLIIARLLQKPNGDMIQANSRYRRFRYIKIVFYILALLSYCSMTLHIAWRFLLHCIFSLYFLFIFSHCRSKWLRICALKIILYTLLNEYKIIYTQRKILCQI